METFLYLCNLRTKECIVTDLEMPTTRMQMRGRKYKNKEK